ncbi:MULTISPECIES: hypothetical protein [Gordonia]|uniref:Uncharacterized protein n=1 Tax=Gordonia terrae C-6 TaxID=1316928 RepID=R7Y713_9ACTN|nr:MULTISPECIES: hypothetical protein [Gordonia]EON31785.1 hypothetical protein GTC6_15953 [Gordonia terrae C-6]
MTLIFVLALVVIASVAGTAGVLTLTARRTPAGQRTPGQRIADWFTRDSRRPYGPDSERVAAELSILTRRYDKLV